MNNPPVRYETIEVGAVFSCPACVGKIVVGGALDSKELSSSFNDAVQCDDCGARFDVEWSAERTIPGRWIASVLQLRFAAD